MVCRAYADKEDWGILQTFSDAERSGITTYGREGLLEMMAFIQRNPVDFVLVEDVDRLSRSAADTHMLAQILEEAEVALVTVANGVVDDLQLAFKAIQNQQYVRQTAQKTRRGQELAVEQGRISGSVTYGHKKVFECDERGKPINGLREINDKQAKTVLWIFEEYVAGVSTIDICRDLNARGVSAPKGGKWSPGALTGSAGASLGILRNRLYIGEFVWGRTKRRRKGGRIRTKPTAQADRKVSLHPELAFVPRDLFDAAQALLEERGKGRFHEWRQTDYLLSRKLYCGVCGSRVAVLNKWLGCMGRNRKGVCDNVRRVDREALEEACVEQLKGSLLHEDLIETSLKAYRDEAERLQAEHQARASSATLRLAEITRELPGLTQKYIAAEGYLADVLKREIETREAERQRLERETAHHPRANPALLSADVIVPQFVRPSMTSGSP
jgi:site-specific DNA recombinase